MTTPQEQNTTALELAKSSIEKNTEALDRATAAMNGIVSGPRATSPEGVTPQGGTPASPFGGANIGFALAKEISVPNYSDAFNPDKLRTSASMFTDSINTLDLGIKTAIDGSVNYAAALKEVPAAASAAAEGSNRFLSGLGAVATGAVAIFGSLQQIKKGGTGNVLSGLAGIFGTISGLTGSGIGGLFGRRASGGPMLQGRPYLVGEQGPELVVPGAASMVTSTQQLFSRSRSLLQENLRDRENSGDSGRQSGGFIKGSLEVVTKTQSINSVEYVTAEEHKRGVEEAAQRGFAMSQYATRNSVSFRKRAGFD